MGPVSELGELFKIAKFKNPIFRKIQNLITFLSFELQQPFIHFLNLQTRVSVIIRQGQNSDIATGKGSGAKFSLYRRTHCTLIVIYVILSYLTSTIFNSLSKSTGFFCRRGSIYRASFFWETSKRLIYQGLQKKDGRVY